MKPLRQNMGFALCLIGVAGLAEGQLISLLIIGLGAYLMRGCNEEEVNKHSTTDGNVLGRLYFLR